MWQLADLQWYAASISSLSGYVCLQVAIKPSLPAEFMGIVSNPQKCEYGSPGDLHSWYAEWYWIIGVMHLTWCLSVFKNVSNAKLQAAYGLEITLCADSEPNTLTASESTAAFCTCEFMWSCVSKWGGSSSSEMPTVLKCWKLHKLLEPRARVSKAVDFIPLPFKVCTRSM